jgi:hypothetical protein
MNAQDIHNLQEAYQGIYNQIETYEDSYEETYEDLYDEVLDYLLDEGYSVRESIEIMIALAEQGAVQGSLFTSKGKPQNFRGKPGGKPPTPFVKTEPVPTKSRVQASPPRTSASTARQSPGQLSIPKSNKPANPSSSGRSQQFKDVQRLIGRTGGGLMGTTKPTNIEPRAPKPAWKSTPKPTSTSTAKPTAKPTSTPKPTAKPNPYRPGATVRATGPNMDKFPQLQRFANQARKVAEPVSKVAGAVAGLTRITPAGVAAAVSAPRPTGDATLTGALKRGDYKPMQGPKNPDQGLTKSQSFDRKFKAAKESGAKQFDWAGKTYTTKVK